MQVTQRRSSAPEAHDLDSFAVGVDETGSRYIISLVGDGAEGLFLLTPAQASEMAGMLLAALARNGTAPTHPQPRRIN